MKTRLKDFINESDLQKEMTVGHLVAKVDFDSEKVGEQLFNLFQQINKDDPEFVVRFDDVEYYADQIYNIWELDDEDIANTLAQKLCDYATSVGVMEKYEMDLDNDIAEEHAKLIIDEAINSHKLSGIFNMNKLFDKVCTDNGISKFDSRRAMVHSALVEILSQMLEETEALDEHIEERRSFEYPIGWAVLPAGKINLSTGETDYFNVLEDSRDTLVLCKKNGSSYLVISGSGDKSSYEKNCKVGDIQKAYHDQNLRMFDLEVVGYYDSDAAGIGEIKNKTGKNSVPFAVFK